ncbi:LuxR C-terminal-related transcriptional regulator [Pseudomonas sp. QL9]|uniref:LuxR C-terminal-related transcriptional regulator n=1 Tax=Pseudomonas sp. QL9 TaxID=3242725 RepID=UPI00352A2947
MQTSSIIRVVLIGPLDSPTTEVCLMAASAKCEIAVVTFDEDFERQIEQHQPHVLLLGSDAVQDSILAVIETLSARWPVLLVARHRALHSVMQALLAGASGYLLGGGIQHELPLALRTVLEGYRYLSPCVLDPLLNRIMSGVSTDHAGLTERQSEVLYWLARGHSVKEVAFLMNLSIKTVNSHKIRLMARLGIRDMTGLVLYGLRQGIIDLPA